MPLGAEAALAPLRQDVDDAVEPARLARHAVWALWVSFALVVLVVLTRAVNGTLDVAASIVGGALAVSYGLAFLTAVTRPADGGGAWRFLVSSALAAQGVALLIVASGAGVALAAVIVSILVVTLWADWRLPLLVAGLHLVLNGLVHLSGLRVLPLSPEPTVALALYVTGLAGGAAVASLVADSMHRAIARIVNAQKQTREDRDAHVTLVRQLEAERERLRVVLASIPAGVVLAVPAQDAETAPDPYRVVLANDGLARLLRHRVEAGGRLAPYASFAGWAADGSLLQGRDWPVSRALLAGEVVRGEEIRLHRADGTHAFVLAHAAPIRDDVGRITAAVMVLLDVTERKEAERALATSRRAAEERERVSGLAALVGGVAHEVRTPLTYIGTNVEIIRVRLAREAKRDASLAPLVADLDRYVAEAREGIERITRLVANLRQVTKVQPGRRVAQSLDEVVRAAIELFRVTYRSSVTVQDELRPTSPVLVDRAQIQQVVLNLLLNAAEAMPNGGRIRVETGEIGGVPQLAVQDEGPGIPLEARARLFSPFFTTKEEGMGLGLSISKGIVEAHGGSIEFETVLSTGTTFRVRLPGAAAATALPLDAPRPRLRIGGQ